MPIKEEEVWSVISLVLFPLHKVDAEVEECVLSHTAIFGSSDAKPAWVDPFEVVLHLAFRRVFGHDVAEFNCDFTGQRGADGNHGGGCNSQTCSD